MHTTLATDAPTGAAQAAAPVLKAMQLTRKFGENLAVNGLDLTVAPGEIYCLLGPNGAGKTTTINLFLGFIPPTSGTAIIAGWS